LSAFEAYFVELPPGESTVQHDHLDDRAEDLYVIVRGSGWVVVDDERVPVEPHQFVAVTLESSRQLVAGNEGPHFVAVCGGTTSPA
jgi:mannose-6-phosphate isomerase-like protein (cupin superfamily)